jgi:VWFA-related protein
MNGRAEIAARRKSIECRLSTWTSRPSIEAAGYGTAWVVMVQTVGRVSRSCTLGVLCLITFAIQSGQLSAQQQKAPQSSTLKTGTQLVILDVVVTDTNGRPVPHLQSSDFAVEEDSNPQAVSSFEDHTSDNSAVVHSSVPALPRGTFTNKPERLGGSSSNIILIDELNTPLVYQARVRQQLSQYLGNVPAGTNLAVFGLNPHVVMWQDFTSDSSLLKHALDGRLPRRSSKLSDASEQGSTNDVVGSLIRRMEDEGKVSKEVLVQLHNGADRYAAAQTKDRAKATLDAFAVFARFLAGIPGRKNLIWISGSFPVNLLPRPLMKYDGIAQYDSFASAGSAEREYRDTVNLMSSAQIAVYPIHAKGLQVSPTNSVENDPEGGFGQVRYGDDESRFVSDTMEEHHTMERTANDTGGRAFLNSNAIQEAISSAVSEGNSFYTIMYSPSNRREDGRARSIKVRLARSGYHLSYRHFYYAEDRKVTKSALVPDVHASGPELHGRVDERALTRVMAKGLPDATELIYQAKISPVVSRSLSAGVTSSPTPTVQPVMISFLIDPRNLALKRRPDGIYEGLVEFVSVAYKADGKIAASTSSQIQVSADDAQYQALQKGDIPFRQVLRIPIDSASLRTAVFDVQGGRVGAFEVPMRTVRALPPIPDEKPEHPTLLERRQP